MIDSLHFHTPGFANTSELFWALLVTTFYTLLWGIFSYSVREKEGEESPCAHSTKIIIAVVLSGVSVTAALGYYNVHLGQSLGLTTLYLVGVLTGTLCLGVLFTARGSMTTLAWLCSPIVIAGATLGLNAFIAPLNLASYDEITNNPDIARIAERPALITPEAGAQCPYITTTHATQLLGDIGSIGVDDNDGCTFYDTDGARLGSITTHHVYNTSTDYRINALIADYIDRTHTPIAHSEYHDDSRRMPWRGSAFYHSVATSNMAPPDKNIPPPLTHYTLEMVEMVYLGNNNSSIGIAHGRGTLAVVDIPNPDTTAVTQLTNAVFDALVRSRTH